MKGGFANALVFGLLVIWPTSSIASSLVSVPHPNSEIQGGGYGTSSETYLYEPKSYEHSNEVRNRLPLHNRVEWQLIDYRDSVKLLRVESDAYSVCIAEHTEHLCNRDGTCGPVLFPDYYDDSTVTGRIPLQLSQTMFVTVTLESESLHRTPHFQLDYFGRSAVYATDVESGALLPATTLLPDVSTTDPLDVLKSTDRFWAPAGNHLIWFELESDFKEYGQLFDGSARFVVKFSTVPEPATMLPLLGGYLFLLRRSDARPARRAAQTELDSDVVMAEYRQLRARE